MQDDAFFDRDEDRYLPTPTCRGPWDPKSLHGRVVAGLLAHHIETQHGADTFTPARLTVDMYRLPGFDPITVDSRLVRDGKRIKVVDAELFSGGVSVARATSQLLLRTGNPEGNIWSPPSWNAPPPDLLPEPEGHRGLGMWDTRVIDGAMGSVGRKRMWMRERRPLVTGVPLSAWSRVALAADFTSPFANAGDQGLAYINTDITLYLHRLPEGEWIGFDVVNHQASDGVCIGECFLYDGQGAIGSSTVAALQQQRSVMVGSRP